LSGKASVRVAPMKLAITRFHEDPFPPLLRVGARPVYPYPMQDDLTDEMAECEFQAVVLDNGLLRATVLPELGGHLLSLRDLVHDRDVFFRNEPLKLGLVAMRGAWWAGGIEFNFPHVGHTVNTVDRVSWQTREEPDGAATVFVGAVEHLTGMAWSVALTLRPDDWRLHTRIRLHNRTPFVHRIYFWSNSAVPARDDFRLLLPATKVFSWWYGADRDASFPMHDGRDLSRYANLTRGGDIFAKDLRADWFGGYYDELDCGLVHYASRFEVPGRKMFSWGHGGHGAMWAELLNARGEPYVELQSGRFVHQGVHRLIAPGAVESWEESWAPVWGLGGVVHATRDVALNAAREGGELALRLLALARVDGALLAVRQEGQALAMARLDLAPGGSHALRVALRGDAPATVELGGEAVTLRLEGDTVRPALDAAPPHIGLPDPAPDDKPTTPGGWLLHARHAEERNHLAEAADAYRAALALDPACVAALAGLAQCHLKRGETAAARDWANKALRVDPQCEDALWWLSVACFADARGEIAPNLGALSRSARHAASAAALLGEAALRRGDPLAALDLLATASERNPHDARVLALAAYAARRGGALDSARALLDECAKENPLEPLLWSESYLISLVGGTSLSRDPRRGDTPPTAMDGALGEVFGSDPQTFLDAACDYARIGDWEAAAAWLRGVACRLADPARQAMLHYHIAHALWSLGRAGEALAAAREAARCSPLFVNPYRIEDAEALRTALRLAPDDALAHLLLGHCLAAAGRWDEAVEQWTRCTRIVGGTPPSRGTRRGDTPPTAPGGEVAALAWRNLGLHRWHKQHNASDALAAYARALDAVSSRPSTPPSPNPQPPTPLQSAAWRLWLERDSVLSGSGRHDERVAAFESAPDAVKAKWQVLARWADACLRAGRPEETIRLLSGCRFKPWEGEARPRVLWKEAHMALGHRAKEAGHLAEARGHFEAAADYPHHLAVGRPTLTDDADAFFWAGWCAAQGGDASGARRLLAAAAGETQPREAATAEFKARAAELLKALG